MGSYNYYKVLGCFNRKFKISEAGPPPDVKDAFSLYTENGSHMTGDQFSRFMVEYQYEKDCTINDAEQIIQEVINRRQHLTRNTGDAHSLELDDFFYYLFQDDLNAPIKSQVHHDMNAPLQHYFIYTGHNSYLTGNQLSSDCSEIPIIRALERGVRGIELDLWPNSAKDNVHVLHGRTLTTPVPLFTCLRSIRDHAFIKSPYPVIITLEDHLTPDLQAKVAELVIQVFGEMLYYPQSECLEEFPSPEELKHRIILSTKPPKEYLESKHHRDIETASPAKKHSVEGDILVKETSEVATEGHEAYYGTDTDQDDEDGDTSNYQSSQQGTPQYQRLKAIHAGKAKNELKHEVIPEELEHQIVQATKSPREDPNLKHTGDNKKETIVRKDSVEKDVLVKDMTEVIVEEHEADETNVMDQDDKDSDPSNHQSSHLGAPQYKRMVAMHVGKANCDLKHVQIPEELKHQTVLATKSPREDPDLKHARDKENATILRKDSVERDFLIKETSEITVEEHGAERKFMDQDDKDTDSLNLRSSQLRAPQYKRMVTIQVGKANNDLKHAPIKHQTVHDTKSPREDPDLKHARDKKKAIIVRKDSVERDFLVKDMAEITVEEHEADERKVMDQDDKHSDPSNHRSFQLGAPQYKRMVAMHAGKANYELKHAQIPEELENGTPLSPKMPKEYVDSRNQRDRENASPVKKDSVGKDLVVKETSEIKEKHEAHRKTDIDQDDPGSDHSSSWSSHQGAPQYKRMVAINAGKVECGSSHSPTPQEHEHHRSGESQSSAKKDSFQDLLVKEDSEIIGHEIDDRSGTDQDDEDNDTSNNQSSQPGAPHYKRLIAIRAGKAKHGVKHALTDETIKFNRLSLDEQALEKAAANHGKDLIWFTQRNILRVFPKGTRVTSSNFKPMTGWMNGAQMVAFNMQGYGKSLWIMHGMFRSNGGCGYVRKPGFLMERGPCNEVFDPKMTLPVKKTLRVRVYLGDGWRMDFSHTHFDAFSPPDFYTKLYIIGVPADAAKRKTRIIEDDWGPIWGEEFKFPLTVPELALLRIEVREYDMSDKDDFGGQTCLPVSELRSGIRAVPLYDKKGEKLKSVRLLMQFRFV